MLLKKQRHKVGAWQRDGRRSFPKPYLFTIWGRQESVEASRQRVGARATTPATITMTDQLDLHKFFADFQDHFAPKLTTYEQAVYLYVFRHSRLLGLEEATIGFKSARNRMALGLGKANTPMSEGSVYQSLRSLEVKHAITILRTEHSGRLIRLHLPHEISGLIPAPASAAAPDIETMDFFEVPEYRLLILKREGYKCFYTLQRLDDKNFVIEHVVSRPNGDNSYRNVVAASREINNRKGSMTAEDFLRKLFRDGFLSASELEERLLKLARLQAGEIKPEL